MKKKERIVIELDGELKRQFKSKAAAKGETLKDIVIAYIKSFVDEPRSKITIGKKTD